MVEEVNIEVINLKLENNKNSIEEVKDDVKAIKSIIVESQLENVKTITAMTTQMRLWSVGSASLLMLGFQYLSRFLSDLK